LSTAYHKPKKFFGQHFLSDKNVLNKIVAAAKIAPGDVVLEVGPGTGELTEVLLEAGAYVVAIEIDRDLTTSLKQRFARFENFRLIEKDALKVSYLELGREYGSKLKAVSNLPYNISGPITAKFVEEREAFSIMVLMYQKEVARRLCAQPGNKDYGALTVITRIHADVKIAFDVPRTIFRPPPKVDSSVVVIAPRPHKDAKDIDEKFFKEVVRAAFSTRRKTLHNALKSLDCPQEAVLEAIAQCGIDPKRRGETLDINEFARLTNAISTALKNIP